MKQRILKSTTLLLLSLFAISSYGQSFYHHSYKYRNSGSFDKGTSILSLSYGVFDYKHGFKDEFYKANSHLGPFHAQIEQGVLEELGVGFRMGVAFSEGKHNTFQFNTTSFTLGLHAIYHFNRFIPVEPLDVYLGAGVGGRYNVLAFERNEMTGVEEFKVNPVAFLGVRYYFVPNVGVFAQGGYDGFSTIQAGLSFRF
ncbi:MAG TPA: hypothetical protein VFD78_00240 [Chitinophagaceae bacterium]|nr:hypothetical protein [Chitinophagaceae bacterium]